MNKNIETTQTKDIEQVIDELDNLTDYLTQKPPTLKNGIPVLNDIISLANQPTAAKNPLEKTNIPAIIFDKIAETTYQKILQELDSVIDNLKEQIKDRIDQELKANLNPISSKSALSSLNQNHTSRPK